MRLVRFIQHIAQRLLPKHFLLQRLFVMPKSRTIAMVCGICSVMGLWLYILSDTSSLTFERESLVSFDEEGELLSFFVNDRENFKVSIDTENEEIPHLLQNMIILYEDKRFFSHSGVDMLALLRTIWTNLSQAKRYGASTITMQVTKLGSAKKRTWWNKFTQTLQALRLEWQKDKDEILRLYVDNTPYGSNIVGIKSAALLYYKKPLQKLSPAESALLAVIPNTPNLLFTNPKKLLQKRDFLLQKALESKLISEQEYKLALLERVPLLDKSNSIAPHLTIRLSKQYPSRKVFYTSLHKNTQALLESTLQGYATIIRDKGVQNLSALVIDTHSSAVIAYVGSQDFYDLSQLGQIDGIQAKRNVGSTLKPFLYGLALDSGLIIPQTKLMDANRFYGNFNPHNASRTFYGQASALYALRNSLNAPFVALLYEYGVPEFFYFLRSNAPFSERDFSTYGLSLILGTKELSLFQLAKLYLGLRLGGDFSHTPTLLSKHHKQTLESTLSPHDSKQTDSSVDSSVNETERAAISHTSPTTATEAVDIVQDYIQHAANTHTSITKESAYLTLQALLNLPLNARSSRFSQKIAWKSGTSFGNRDSWAIGVSDRYIVAVWGGNFNAKSSVNLTGREIAGVLMFDIFELLGGNSMRDFSKWSELGKWTNAPKMREVLVDKRGYRISSQSTKGTKAYMPYYAKPLQSAQNAPMQEQLIIYPTPNLVFSRSALVRDKEGIIALINTKKRSYFFLNNEFIGVNDVARIRLEPRIGTNSLYIITQDGQSDSVEFEVLD